MDGKNEIQGYMLMGKMRYKDTCGWGNEMQGYMWMGKMRYKDTCGMGGIRY